jgi:hypothetical protein
VTILPPNTAKATSGFLIRGRNDIIIDGFDIAGATDAGIEVRARPAGRASQHSHRPAQQPGASQPQGDPDSSRRRRGGEAAIISSVRSSRPIRSVTGCC